MAWQLQDAKARFSELVDATIKDGPQVVTRRGIEAVVVVPVEEWRRLQASAHPSLKELLLAPTPHFENLIQRRHTYRRRSPVQFK